MNTFSYTDEKLSAPETGGTEKKNPAIPLAAVIFCFAAIALAVSAGVVCFPMLQVHTEEKAVSLLWDVEESQNESGQTLVRVSFRCVNTGRKVFSVKTDRDASGNVDLQVSTRGLSLIARTDPQSSYDVDIEAGGDPSVGRITLASDTVLWEDGLAVERFTALLFEAGKNDAPQAEQIDTVCGMLGLNDWLDSTPVKTITKLISDDSPNRLTIILDGDLVRYYRGNVVTDLKTDSCILIALIDEIEEVLWDYTLNGKKETLRFDISDAAAMLASVSGGSDIKTYGKTAGGLQKLMTAICFDFSAAPLIAAG